MSYRAWSELESDPGLFTSLIEDLGVRNVEVEEVYDLSKPIDGEVYGLIFLFRWKEERRVRRKINSDEQFVTNEDQLGSIFFAQQVINNSCATHSLLSVLLNCSKVDTGELLRNFKEFSKDMDAATRGFAIGNIPELAIAHNRHARADDDDIASTAGASQVSSSSSSSSSRSSETFHFTSLVPVNSILYELDGLKPSPISHGSWFPDENWTDLARRVITDKIVCAQKSGTSSDIRYNLMAVVKDRRVVYQQILDNLSANYKTGLDIIRTIPEYRDVAVRTSFVHCSKRTPVSAPAAVSQILPNLDAIQLDIWFYRYLRQLLTASKDLVLVHVQGLHRNELATFKEHYMYACEDPPPLPAEDEVIESRSPRGTETANSADDFNWVVKLGSEKLPREFLKELLCSQPGKQALILFLESTCEQTQLYRNLLLEEESKRLKFKIDGCRRCHNYEPFISLFVAKLAQHDILSEFLKSELDRRPRKDKRKKRPLKPLKVKRRRIV